MTTTIVKHTYKLKRGREEAVFNANPLLLAGEPVVVYCNDGTTKLKIGDGVTYYQELPWVGSDNIYCAKKRSSFPNVGNANTIYKEEETATLYQWNEEKFCYEALGGTSETVITLQNEVTVIQQELEAKADASEVSEIQDNVAVLQQSVENKADVSVVNDLEKVVETKIDNKALEAAKAEITSQSASYTDTKISEVNAVLVQKTDDEEFNDLSTTVENLQIQVDNLSTGIVESIDTVTGGTAEDLLASLA